MNPWLLSWLLSVLASAAALAQTPASFRLSVTVPGTSNPYLAGMPDGTMAIYGDRAPRQSPVLIKLPPGAKEVTFAASGGVDHQPGCPGHCDSPDGGPILTEHLRGAESGISDVSAPYNAVIGVFLTDERPDKSRAPRDLRFDAKHRQFTTFSPLLKQIFFIGRGTTVAGEVRRFVVPEGATRLYLGTMDSFEWNNNTGAFQVSVAVEQAHAESAIFSVDSSVSFANWSCLPEQTRCTPPKEIVEERSPGQFHVLLPAQMEWGVSIPTPPGSKVATRDIKGTVCLRSDAETCSGPEGKDPAGEGFLVPQATVGSLVFKTAGGRTYFSVNDRSGAAFQKHEGFFEFDITVQ